MAKLEVVDTIKVYTTEGEREIQLLFGDITKLPVEDKVDVIMVSAFPGDYSATPTSVIGALKRNLNLSVRDLAKDKQEDLRRHFCCWWSKPLPESIPYRRLLCFERIGHGGRHPSQLVGEVFRAMFPVFNNQESTVITPLLAAGDQGFSAQVMMTSMVNAAARWMRHGLPLTSLKVVVYRGDRTLAQAFDGLKKKWEAMKEVLDVEPSIKYDVYLSYCKEDQSRVDEIKSFLESEKKDLKVFAQHQVLDEQSEFQEEIFNVMITCVKVVAVLSPAYLQSAECLEQFNIALCCDRKTRREMLAPFYIETIPALPTYMCMVQYIDVRIGETSEPLYVGCKIFIEQVVNVAEESNKNTAANTNNIQYDVFISYCHRNTEYANQLVTMLQRLNPELRIFFDRNELALGNTWQKALYSAVGGARCMLALLSQDYLKSQVCAEEYNLALAKYICWEKSGDDGEFYLIPIAIESLAEVPYTLLQAYVIDGRQDFTRVITRVAAAVNGYVTHDRLSDIVLVDPKTPLCLSHVMEEHRKKLFLAKLNEMNVPTPTFLGEQSYTVGLSYHAALNQLHAEYLDRLLVAMAPTVRTTFNIKNEHELVTALEKCDLTVTLLSHPFTITRKTTDEFHHAVGRHRSSQTGPVLYPIIMDTHLLFNPLFFHLVPCAVCCADQLWKNGDCVKHWKAQLKRLCLEPECKTMLANIANRLQPHEVLALNFACWDIINILKEKSEKSEQRQNIVLQDILRINLENNDCESPQYVLPDDKFYKKLVFSEGDILEQMESLEVVSSEPGQDERQGGGSEVPCEKTAAESDAKATEAQQSEKRNGWEVLKKRKKSQACLII